MCAPALLLPMASMGMQAMGGMQAASAANAAGKAQQAQYDYQAAQNRQQAEEAIKTGERRDTISQQEGSIESAKHARNVAQVSSSQKAIMAANNIGGGSITSMDVAADTFDKAKMDEVMIRYNADQRSWSAKTGAAYEAWDYTNQANLNTMAGKNARAAGKANANATLLGTAGQVFNSAYNMYKIR